MKSSISDTSKYRDTIKKMLTEETTFNNFKQLPNYTEILEHVSYELGIKYLDAIRRDNPELIERIDDFRINDLYGNPKSYNYDEIGITSPSTIRYVKVLSDLLNLNFDLTNKDVVEIGVGYGGQCLILSKYFDFKSYTLIDLEEPLQLSEKYLKLNHIKNVYFKKMEELEDFKMYDYVLSNYAFTECAKEIQEIYYEKVLKNSAGGYITSNFISDVFNVESYSKEELLGLIDGSKTINEEPSTGKNNMILIW